MDFHDCDKSLWPKISHTTWTALQDILQSRLLRFSHEGIVVMEFHWAVVTAEVTTLFIEEILYDKQPEIHCIQEL